MSKKTRYATSIPGHGKPGPAGPARPSPKKPDPARPDAAPGLGSGLDFEPEGRARARRFCVSEGRARPARSPTGFYVFGPGSGLENRPDGRVGPGLGLSFLRRAWLGPARGMARYSHKCGETLCCNKIT